MIDGKNQEIEDSVFLSLKALNELERVNVDAVSGATNSSKVIEKACVNALTKQ